MRATVRSTAWGIIAATVGIAGAVVALTRLGDGDDPRALSIAVTLASFAIPVIAGVCIDDEAWELTAPSPCALWRQRLARMAVVLSALAASWFGLLASARWAFPRSFDAIEVGATSARVAATAGAAIAVAAVIARFRRDHIGLSAAGVLTAAAVAWNVVSPVQVDGTRAWPWLAALVVAAVVGLAASHEPLPR